MAACGSSVARRLAQSSLLLWLCVATGAGACASASGRTTRELPVGPFGSAPLALPTLLSNAELWGLTNELSEPGGYFSSDNFTSNEMGFPNLAAVLAETARPADVYVGVGPEQNFHYIAALRPRMAFIIDIRRQAMIQQLMYKAIFELAPTRADFVSLLFSKPQPAGLDSTSSMQDIWAAYWDVPGDSALHQHDAARMRNHLAEARGFTLGEDDLATLGYVFDAFYRLGPTISYSGTTLGSSIVFLDHHALRHLGSKDSLGAHDRGAAGPAAAPPVPRGPRPMHPGDGNNFASLTLATDSAGVPRSFLATEANYAFVRGMHLKNLIIPVVGDFAGPKAFRAVADYVRRNGATVSAFYTSNVESYLLRNNVWDQYCQNVAALPIDANSLFIRPDPLSMGAARPDGTNSGVPDALAASIIAALVASLEPSLSPIADFFRTVQSASALTNDDVVQCVR